MCHLRSWQSIKSIGFLHAFLFLNSAVKEGIIPPCSPSNRHRRTDP